MVLSFLKMKLKKSLILLEVKVNQSIWRKLLHKQVMSLRLFLVRMVMKMNFILKQLISLNLKERHLLVSYKGNFKLDTIEQLELLI